MPEWLLIITGFALCLLSIPLGRVALAYVIAREWKFAIYASLQALVMLAAGLAALERGNAI